MMQEPFNSQPRRCDATKMSNQADPPKVEREEFQGFMKWGPLLQGDVLWTM